MHHHRVRILKEGAKKKGPIVYWMSRDQRAHDNWSLLFAQQLALERKEPLIVLFCLTTGFLGATARQYDFMLKGLQETENELRLHNIPLQLLIGDPPVNLLKWSKEYNVSTIITDFDPLRIKQHWKNQLIKNLLIPFFEVDSHNVIPCWFLSNKAEYGAYTIRPKIHRLLQQYLDVFPPLLRHPFSFPAIFPATDWSQLQTLLQVNQSISKVSWLKPGSSAAQLQLKKFLTTGLPFYQSDRNNPTKDAQSHLSPYLHFGQLSAQRAALEILRNSPSSSSQEAFLEELIVRRELSDNFCFYNSHYDQISGFPSWAQQTLNAHRQNLRTYTYSFNSFESAQTHDDLWNAAQREMITKGKMHGYLRMYWAKKILEWTKSPEEALETAIHLNDKYQLDGRDPNGYTGIAWSIGGVHDRAWKERAIFGKIRYMSYNGMKNKFPIQEYIKNT